MCTGLEIAGLALAAAGTGTSMYAAKQSQGRMNDVIQQQLAAQRGFQQQATPVFQQSLDASSPNQVGQQISLGQQSASELYNKLRSLPMSSSSSPLPNDPQTQIRTEQQIGQQAGAQAGLQGYQNFGLAQWLKDMEARNQLGVISGLSSSSAATTPYLLQGARNSTANLAGIGSLLGTGGSLLGMYGSLIQQPAYGSMQKPVTADVPYNWGVK